MPPPTCCKPDYDAQFDEKSAREDLLTYRKDGPDGSTKRLIEALRREGVEGATLLDIGGGVGVIQLELLAAGAASAMDVDASSAFLAAAEQEADARGFRDRVAYRYGDFVELADEVEAADIVTLDRVICCYPDVHALVGRSVARARRLYGLVYPVDRWWTRGLGRLGNAILRLFRSDFRLHVHPDAVVEALVRDAGFERRYRHAGWVWQTVVYARP
jgi:SAM-dependent methyltransferase